MVAAWIHVWRLKVTDVGRWKPSLCDWTSSRLSVCFLPLAVWICLKTSRARKFAQLLPNVTLPFERVILARLSLPDSRRAPPTERLGISKWEGVARTAAKPYTFWPITTAYLSVFGPQTVYKQGRRISAFSQKWSQNILDMGAAILWFWRNLEPESIHQFEPIKSRIQPSVMALHPVL